MPSTIPHRAPGDKGDSFSLLDPRTRYGLQTAPEGHRYFFIQDPDKGYSRQSSFHAESLNIASFPLIELLYSDINISRKLFFDNKFI